MLVVPREEASAKIKARIEMGQTLLKGVITTEEAFKAAHDDYYNAPAIGFLSKQSLNSPTTSSAFVPTVFSDSRHAPVIVMQSVESWERDNRSCASQNLHPSPICRELSPTCNPPVAFDSTYEDA